jgi:uncharacterized protein YqeY
MLIKERISKDFIQAFKEKNMGKKNFLGLLKASIETQEKKLIESTDENVLKVLKIIEKNLKETIENKKKINVSSSDDETELSYLQDYLPKPMTENEIRSIISDYIQSGDNKNSGFLIGKFNKENKGKNFDNNLVSSVIKELI